MDFIQDCSILAVCSCPEYVSSTLEEINLVSGLYVFFVAGSMLNKDMYKTSGGSFHGQASLV